jgi:ABC-type multidrug transport system ATPase subunit
MLATLLPIDAGQARVFGVDVAREPHRVRQLLGVTGQYASVDEELTAAENLWLFGRLQGLRSVAARATANRLLEEFALKDAADKPLSQFSGGMRRRLDLAVSLITRPPLIFLDEPTTGLDPRTRGQMWATIRGLVAEGCTVLLTTQYLDEADQLAMRIAVIDRGRKVAEGTPDELKTSVGNSTLQIRLAPGTDQELARQVVRRVAGVERRLVSPDELDKVLGRHRAATACRQGREQRPRPVAHDRSPPPAHIVKQVQGDGHPASLKCAAPHHRPSREAARRGSRATGGPPCRTPRDWADLGDVYLLAMGSRYTAGYG